MAAVMTKKDAILVAAQEAFGQLGYSGTTMKDVSKRANVSFGLVSHYFGNKHDLFLAAGFDMVDRLIKTLRQATAKEKCGLDAARAYMVSYYEFTIKHRETFPVLLRCSPFSHIEPGVNATKVAERFQDIIDAIREAVARGVEDGSIRDLPVEETALIIYGNIIGAVRTKLLTPYDTERIYAETIRHVMRSLECGSSPQDGNGVPGNL
jgi:AcrR family transcriptional regulator